MMLLGAILSDTVLLTSPTTTERDHAVTGYLEELLSLDAQQFGREMFEHRSDVAECPPPTSCGEPWTGGAADGGGAREDRTR